MTKNLLLLFSLIFNICISYGQKNISWKFKTDGRIYSTPKIDNNILYFGSGDQHIYALDAETGKLLWKFKTAGKVHSSPDTNDNNVFFSSTDGNVYCLNKTTGNLVWKFESEGEKQHGLWDYYLSSPKVEDNILYWGSGDSNIYAINSINGKVIWKYKTNDIVHADPVIYEEGVYIGSFDGHLYKLNKYNGALVWKFKTIGAAYFPKGEIQKKVTIHNGRVYFGSRDYNLYVVDAKNGKGVWNYRQPKGWVISTPTIYQEFVYFGSSDGHTFYCFDINSTNKKWEIPTNMRTYSQATWFRDEILFSTFDGKIVSVNYKTGSQNWEFQTDASKKNYSKIYKADGTFQDDFKLYGEDYLESEKMIHNLGSILSDPILHSNKLYFGSSDGNLYALILE
ncbi:outer membrane protein assembly factor BamB family protein [Tamlana flava]|uniref:outer membrane protein assembly factor BamB family protein n=1 Tax=Tamlana flava TaxID=3158572 RepID=UPI00351B0DB6